MVFFLGVPTPEVALTGDGGFEKVGECVKGCRIVELGPIDFRIDVEVINGAGPGEVSDTRAASSA